MANVITRSQAMALKRKGQKLTKKQAGSLGGQATLNKFPNKKTAKNHMRSLAVKGARAMHEKYKWEKLGASDFMLTLRATGRPTGKTINGKVLPVKGWTP